MSFPLAPAQLQENPRAASSSCRRAARARVAPCAVFPALGLQFLPTTRARNEKLVLFSRPFHVTVSPTATGKMGQRGPSLCKRAALLLARERFLRRRGHLLAKGSWGSGCWCQGVPGPQGGTEPLVAEGAAPPGYSWSLRSGEGNYFWIFSMAGGLFLAGGATERERGPSAGSSLRPYLTFRQLSLSLSKGHG